MTSIHVQVWCTSKENILSPSSKDLEFFTNSSDLASAAGDNGWCADTFDKAFVLKESALETLLHKYEIVAIQCFRCRDEGWTNRRKRLGDRKCFEG